MKHIKTDDDRMISLRALAFVSIMQEGHCICEVLKQLSDAEMSDVAYFIDNFGDAYLKLRWAQKTRH